MEKTIVSLSQLSDKGAWHFQPYSEVVTAAFAHLYKSSFPIIKLCNLMIEGTARRGYSIKGSEIEKGIPVLSVRNVSGKGVNLEQVEYITPEEHKKLEQTQVKQGDVLVCLVARPGTAAVYQYDQTANINTHLVRLRLTNDVEPGYLAYYLNSDIGQSLIRSLTTGSIQPVLTIAALMNLPVILPPLVEQQKIISKFKQLAQEAEELSEAAEECRVAARTLLNELLTEE